MYADGCNLLKAHKIKIDILLKDKDVLDKMRDVFETNAPIRAKHGFKIKGTNYQGSPVARFEITSAYLSNRLCELGVLPNKTYILKFPNFIKENLLRHFVRGYFDGDGSITIGKRNRPKICIASTVEFLRGIKDYCDSQGWNTFIYSKKGCDKSFGTLEAQSKETVKNFLDWIYKDSNIYCERKYQRYYSYYYLGQELTKYEKIDNDTLMELYGNSDN